MISVSYGFGGIYNHITKMINDSTLDENVVIDFYSHRQEKYKVGDEYRRHFSNFSEDPVLYNGILYKTSEHAFQAQKAVKVSDVKYIAEAPTAMEAAKRGRDRSLEMRKDWDACKVLIMWRVLLCKFTQHSECANALLSTGNAYIEERTKNDSYWGTGSDEDGGTGKNMLGKLLMGVRKVLRTPIL